MDGYSLHQGCRSDGTLAQNVTREDSLGSAVPIVLLLSDQHLNSMKNMYTHTHTHISG